MTGNRPYIFFSANVIPGIILSLIFFSSCFPPRKIPEGQYLLKKNVIEHRKDKVILKIPALDELTDELTPLIKQKPNRRIFGFIPFHFTVYNLANKGNETKIKSWIKNTIGEPPVLLDPVLKSKSAHQLQLFLFSKGFFNATVTDSVFINKRKRATVFFIVYPGTPYTVRNIMYDLKDPWINDFISGETRNSLVKPGKNYEADILSKERERITAKLKEAGYYYFRREFIFFKVDSTLGTKQVDLTMVLNRLNEDDSLKKPENHRQYYIHDIFVTKDHNPRAVRDTAARDTVEFNTYKFINRRGNNYLRPNIIEQSIFLKKGDLFQQSRLDNTYKRLFDLGIFKFVNIKFQEATKDTGLINDRLDCIIQLTPAEKQSYTIETEGTHSNGNLGIAGNIAYRNKNIFRNAELFEFKINGALEAQKALSSETPNDKIERLYFFNTLKIKPEASLNFQKFVVPWNMSKASKSNNPKTTISIMRDYEQRPDYTKTNTEVAYGFNWRESDTKRWSIIPAEFSLVNVDTAKGFSNNQQRNSEALRRSFEPHLIPAGRYSYIFNNQEIDKLKNFIYMRINLEFAGNLFYGANKLTNIINNDPIQTSYFILGKRYSQYFRPDADFRYYHLVNEHNTIVYRIAGGFGKPYANSNVLPFEKVFYSGGSNDIRAFTARSIGPGSYAPATSVYERPGEIKGTGNIEYRFDLVKILEGGIFLDAGNVWAFKDTARSGAEFHPNTFIKEIAVGTGVGIRFDFTFFVMRVDFGYPLRNPSLPVGERWMLKKLEPRKTVTNLAIGYPF